MFTRRQFFTLSALFVLGAGLAHAQELRCPILMYHYIAEPPEAAAQRSLWVSPANFAAQLDRLREEGFTTITLRTLYDALTSGASLPAKPIVLSFDDGHASAYASAYPLLRERGMTGTFFIVTSYMDQWWEYLTWGQAAEMWTGGMEIGCHSTTHTSLRGLGAAALAAEVEGAADTIETALGRRPEFYCYPFGHVDRAAARAVRESGFLAAVTTQDGIVTNNSALYYLPRVRVRHTTTPDELMWMTGR
jgi:peptidoglycan/xylan/chitin deacetylase (PgdA/CDA1 family)